MVLGDKINVFKEDGEKGVTKLTEPSKKIFVKLDDKQVKEVITSSTKRTLPSWKTDELT